MGGEQMAKKNGKKANVRRIIITVAAIYMLFNLVKGGAEIVDMQRQQHQLARELDAAYAAQEELQAQLDYMHTEDAIEAIAREKLGLVKDGEILIQRVETAQTP